MASNPNRGTQFPGGTKLQEYLIPQIKRPERDFGKEELRHEKSRPAPKLISAASRVSEASESKRHTRFPGLPYLSIPEMVQKTFRPEETKLAETNLAVSPRLDPIDLSPASRTLKKQKQNTLRVKKESPWMTYTAYQTLERGGKIISASTQEIPLEMVGIKELFSDNFMDLAEHQHENLLSIFEAFEFEDGFFVITDYTVSTLKQIISIPLQLEETHISATCRQVFEGMKHLSKYGIAHKKIDSSKILFTANGCMKIAHFDEYQTNTYFDEHQVTAAGLSYSVGSIALEMMQNNTSSEEDEKFHLEHPDHWSPLLKNFMCISFGGTLEALEKHRFLQYVSPTFMIPFIEYARWNIIESVYLKIALSRASI